MSRSVRGGKAGYDWEYWSRRPTPCSKPCKESKKMTHRIERKEAAVILRDKPKLIADIHDDYWYPIEQDFFFSDIDQLEFEISEFNKIH